MVLEKSLLAVLQKKENLKRSEEVNVKVVGFSQLYYSETLCPSVCLEGLLPQVGNNSQDK